MLHVMVRWALWFVCGATLSVAAAGAHAQDPAGQTARPESSLPLKDCDRAVVTPHAAETGS